MFGWFTKDKDALIAKLTKERDELAKSIPSLLGQIQEQKGILDYTLHDKEQEIARIKAELDQWVEWGEGYKQQIADLTKRNEELEAWGKRLAVEATQELTGNKRKSFNPELSKSKLKSMRQAWEDGELSKLKIVKKK